MILLEKKSLLFVLPTLRLAGAEKSLVSLLKSLDYNRVDVDLFLFERGGVLEKEVPEFVNILDENVITRAMTLELRPYFSDLLSKRLYGAALSRLHKSVRSTLRRRLSSHSSCDWELVCNHISSLSKAYDCAISYLEGTTAMFVLDKVTATRKIGWIHTDLAKIPPCKRDCSRYSEFDELVTISDVCYRSMIAFLPTKDRNAHVIPNITISSDLIKKANEFYPINWEDGKTHIVTVGRLEHIKGIDIAIDACRELKERNLNFVWHVFGEGPLRHELAQKIQNAGLNNDFILEGLVVNPYPYMRHADIIVQSSRFEGKSIVLDEAKILGKAIISTNYPSVYDQIQDGVTGLICEMSPSGIASSIEKLMLMPELKQSLEANCSRVDGEEQEIVRRFYDIIGV